MKISIHLKEILMIIVCLFTYANVSAHALWIETNNHGQIGNLHKINIYYGEFASKEIDAPDKWYSDVKDFTLWLISPDGKKTRLNTTQQDSNYMSHFTPETDGVYTLLVSHVAAELGGTTKYEFISSAYVDVGSSAGINSDFNTNSLKLYTQERSSFNKLKALKIKAQLNGNSFSNQKVIVASPIGWTKEYTTNEHGIFEFIPLWAGRYMIEIQDYREEKGIHNSNAFQASWIGSTYSFQVED